MLIHIERSKLTHLEIDCIRNPRCLKFIIFVASKISNNHSDIAVPSVAGQGLQQINDDQLFDELEDRQWRACNVVIVIYRNLYYIHR